MNLRQREVVFAHTALGLQFADVATNEPVTGGLRVTAQLLDDDSRRVGRPRTARANPAGIYAFFGLHPEEQTEREFATLLQPQRRRRAVIDVVDPMRRYLPTSFEVALPRRGPFQGINAGLEPVPNPPPPLAIPLPRGSRVRGVALFSVPGRPLQAGLTALHAQIVIGGDLEPSPAPFAVVRVFIEAGDGDELLHAVGMADNRGLVTVPLGYPPINPDGDADPPPSLAEHRFPLSVRVAYDPALHALRPGSTAPDLAKLLDQGGRDIAIARDEEGALTLRSEFPLSLKYGATVILRTRRGNTDKFEGVLRLNP